MTEGAHAEVDAFVQQLEQFHSSLPEDHQRMLEAILDAAEQGTETSGYMMPNIYTTEMVAQSRIDGRLREAEHDRLVSQARRGGEGARAGASRSFDWLHNWLPALRGAEPRMQPRATAE